MLMDFEHIKGTVKACEDCAVQAGLSVLAVSAIVRFVFAECVAVLTLGIEEKAKIHEAETKAKGGQK